MRATKLLWVSAIALALALAAAVLANGIAVTPAPATTRGQASAPNAQMGQAMPGALGAGPDTSPYLTNQLIPLTVSEAWVLSGRNATVFAQMVQQMTELSARNRGINLPDSQAAGTEMGRDILQRVRTNPNQLLYAAVDSAVRDYRTRHPAPAGAGAGPVPAMYSAGQLMPLTVAQAWRLSGQNYSAMTSMVKTLAEVSAQRRGVALPDSMEAGAEMGRSIRQRAEADPNQLLYVVVDASVADYAARYPQTPPR